MNLEDAFHVTVVRPTELRSRLYKMLEEIEQHPERLVELRHQSGSRAYLVNADVLEQMVREREHPPGGRIARLDRLPIEIRAELDSGVVEPWIS